MIDLQTKIQFGDQCFFSCVSQEQGQQIQNWKPFLFQGEMNKEFVPLKMTVHNSVWGILIITFSSLGIFFSLLIMMFFLFKFQHPVVLGKTIPFPGFHFRFRVLVLLGSSKPTGRKLKGVIFLYLLNMAYMLFTLVHTYVHTGSHLYSHLQVPHVRLACVC